MASDLTSELKALFTISHSVGSDPRLIQAGGGNTSIKSSRKDLMVIKASGSTMAQMNASKGWVAVSLAKMRLLLKDTAVMSLPVSQREKAVVERLYAGVAFPEGVRPSVETPMHALLDTAVIHTHPVYANALTCNNDGKQMLAEISKKIKGQKPLWVKYTDPGSVLAFTLAKEIESYAAENGRTPSILFLENHGFVCCAPDAGECLKTHAMWMETIKAHLGKNLDAGEAPLPDNSLTGRIRDTLKTIALIDGKPAPLVRFSMNPALAWGAQESNVRVFTDALTPDHVVYIGPAAVILSTDAPEGEIEEGILNFRARYKSLPRILVARDRGVFLADNSEGRLDAAEALALSAVQIYILTRGNIRFMTPSQVDFIMNWEAEHYRAKQVK